jgi:hypothetical protein
MMRADRLAQILIARAWDENISDDDRQLLEAAAVMIERLSRRVLRVAQELERVELENENAKEGRVDESL